jgi:hypothetical protein
MQWLTAKENQYPDSVSHGPRERRRSDGLVIGLKRLVSALRAQGLDNEHSWIVTTEVNRFFWPGHDVRWAKEPWQPGGPMWHWGFLPANIFNQVRQIVLEHIADKTLSVIPRP